MKRYLLFMWFDGERGGWNDFFSSFDAAESALLVVGEREPLGWQVVDTNVGKIIAEGQF